MREAHYLHKQSSPRTIEYLILRCCERLQLREDEFFSADYSQQIRWLAYEQLRQLEERSASTSSPSTSARGILGN
ncbi:hypothetical protein MNBD_PLANCTO02-2917 [hydrothermal vent metagenome]|uniref:Uncharacterized protein n=1 Tax=hydrothermal vent metagenome TaxID=652676 RepID=A0A3B1DED2_9ZZZZ